MNDIETTWIALLALVSALSIYPLVRKGSHFHWFGLLSIVLLFAMAVETRTAPQPIPQSAQPSFAGIDPINAKALEFTWFVMQQRKANGQAAR